jgi:hypothetical protein
MGGQWLWISGCGSVAVGQWLWACCPALPSAGSPKPLEVWHPPGDARRGIFLKAARPIGGSGPIGPESMPIGGIRRHGGSMIGVRPADRRPAFRSARDQPPVAAPTDGPGSSRAEPTDPPGPGRGMPSGASNRDDFGDVPRSAPPLSGRCPDAHHGGGMCPADEACSRLASPMHRRPSRRRHASLTPAQADPLRRALRDRDRRRRAGGTAT